MSNLNFDCSAEEYYLNVSNQILVILQTESPLGVKNAEAIYSLPGCDGIFVGPNDLRFQMRAADGSFPTDEEHEAMIQRVIQVGRNCGRATGIHVQTPVEASQRIDQGMQFIAVASDLNMLSVQARAVVTAMGLETKKDLARY